MDLIRQGTQTSIMQFLYGKATFATQSLSSMQRLVQDH